MNEFAPPRQLNRYARSQMDNDLKEIFDGLSADVDSISLNPTTLERLRKQGINLPERPRHTPEESVNYLFNDQRKKQALHMYRQLPDLGDIPVPSIQSLYKEIRAAAVLGLHGAAITLSGILLEYALKYAAYKVEMGQFANYDSKKWDEFEALDFANAIGRATKNKLLTKEAKKSLNEFRVRFRNPYNHYNIRKITANYYHPELKVLDTKTKTVETRSVAAKDDPVLQALVKPIADADHVLEVIVYADSIVKYLWSQIKDLPNKRERA